MVCLPGPDEYVKVKVDDMKDENSFVAMVAAKELKRKLRKANKKKAKDKSIKSFEKEK